MDYLIVRRYHSMLHRPTFTCGFSLLAHKCSIKAHSTKTDGLSSPSASLTMEHFALWPYGHQVREIYIS